MSNSRQLIESSLAFIAVLSPCVAMTYVVKPNEPLHISGRFSEGLLGGTWYAIFCETHFHDQF